MVNETINVALATGPLRTEASLAECGLEFEEEDTFCDCFDCEDCCGDEDSSSDEGSTAASSSSYGRASRTHSYGQLSPGAAAVPAAAGGLADMASATLVSNMRELPFGPTQKVLYKLGQEDGLTQYQVTVYMVTAFIGVAVLVLPSLMKLGGWIVPPLLSAFIAFAFLQMVNVMCEAVDSAERMVKVESITKAMSDPNHQDRTNEKQHITTFEDVGRKSVGFCGVVLIRSTTLPGLCGGVLVFSLLIASNIQTLSGKTLGQFQAFAVATPILILFAIMPNEMLAKAMNFGMYVSLTSCTLICVKSLLDSRNWADWPEVEKEYMRSLWPEDIVSLGTVAAVLMSSYSLMATVPTVRAQMARPQEFYAGFRDATIIVFLLYLGVMCCAYYGYGRYVQDNIVESMVFPIERPCNGQVGYEEVHCEEIGIKISKDACLKSWIGFVMTVLTTIDLFLGFALLFKCVSGMIQKLFGENECSKSGSCLNNLMRTVMVGVVVSVAIWVPSFRDILAIRSAICCPTNNIFYPLLFNSKLKDQPYGCCRAFFYLLMVIFACASLVLGLYHAISSLATHSG